MQKLQSFSELFNLALVFFKKHIHAIALISVIPTVLSGAISAMSPHLVVLGTGVTIYLGIIIVITLIALIVLSVVYPVAFARSIEGTERGEVIDTARAYMSSIRDFFPFILVDIIYFFATLGGSMALLVLGIIVEIYFAFNIVYSFATLGGIVAIIIPGIIAGIYFAFTALSFALDRKGGFDAIVSSAWIVRGRWADVFIRFILLGFSIILAYGISWGVIHIILSIAGFGVSVSNFLSGLVLSMFIIPFAFIFKYFLYRSLQSTLVQKDVDPAFAKKVKIWSMIGVIFGVPALLLIMYFQIMLGISHLAS